MRTLDNCNRDNCSKYKSLHWTHLGQLLMPVWSGRGLDWQDCATFPLLSLGAEAERFLVERCYLARLATRCRAHFYIDGEAGTRALSNKEWQGFNYLNYTH